METWPGLCSDARRRNYVAWSLSRSAQGRERADVSGGVGWGGDQGER